MFNTNLREENEKLQNKVDFLEEELKKARKGRELAEEERETDKRAFNIKLSHQELLHEVKVEERTAELKKENDSLRIENNKQEAENKILQDP